MIAAASAITIRSEPDDGRGSYSVFFERPAALVVMVACVLIILWTIVGPYARRLVARRA